MGLHGDSIKIRLAAPPVDGAANEELIRFIAAQLRVPLHTVTLERGRASRQKTVRVTGVTMDQAIRAFHPTR